jgi:hypothetical protein
MALGYAVALRNTRLDAIATRAGTSAVLRIYSGVRPATGGAETTVLAELTCNASAFAAAASGGVLTLNAITADPSANATGTASWFRIQSSGATHVLDGDVGTSGSDLNMSTVSFVSGATISITSATITAGNA